jgi:asparagine synthase (glutamine-hydrolysing)
MCGIAGFVDLRGRVLAEQRDAELLHQLARQIGHRGPDDEQIHLWNNVGLAFRRLSIVDIDGGRQPLFNEDQTILVVCNGEIYNHRDLRTQFGAGHNFRSKSDCEIILHLYETMGMAHISQLNGIFAFALLDKVRKKLFVCRDRLGVKPVYYYCDKSILVFGSEVKAILAHPCVPKQFDWHAALTFRAKMYYPHNAYELTSYFKGIHQLPAGRFLEIDLATGEINERRYWDPAPASDQRADSATPLFSGIENSSTTQCAFSSWPTFLAAYSSAVGSTRSRSPPSRPGTGLCIPLACFLKAH